MQPASGSQCKCLVAPSFPLAVAIFVTTNLLLAYALRRFVRPAVWFTGLILILFPLLSVTSDWYSWLTWVKRYSIVVPAFLWAFLRDQPGHRFSRFLVAALPYVLILNVLEVGLFELQGPNPLNGVAIAIVGFCVPLKWSQRGAKCQFGFRNPLWQVAYVMSLARFFWFHPSFENATAGALIVLALASFLCAAERDSQNYVTWRLYTLYLLVLQDSFFPHLSEHLYPDWMHPEDRLLLQGTPLAHGWLILNCILVTALLVQRLRARCTMSAAEAANYKQ